MSTWFYADNSQQRRGPVTDEQLRIAYQQQQITGSNLVWTEGMSGWQPLSSVAGKLGIQIASTPPPMPFGAQPVFANTNDVILVKSSSGVGWIIAAVIGVCGLFFLAILAAIAIPAYQDYTIRARISSVVYEARSQRIVVEEAYQSRQMCPETSDMNFSEPSDGGANANMVQSREMRNLPDGSCALRYTFKDSAVPGNELHTLTLIRDSDGKWRFETTLPARYLPSSMRNTNEL